ncbi:RDD family protein [Bacillus methanolicus]|uniref:RDD family protein n=1 Tax=Bacillus methanolicus TaxID=1471 RepID=UPI002A4B6792|nr:RDD family protein [Bacillus methanolicus]
MNFNDSVHQDHIDSEQNNTGAPSGQSINENFSALTEESNSSALKQANMQAEQSIYRYAGFWMRFWAYLLDLLVIGSIDRMIVNPLFRLFDLPLHEISMFAPISIATAITFYGYFLLMTKFFGQTLGKMVFGLKVIDLDGGKLSWGTVLFRECIGRFISATVVVGYVIVAFLPKKQGLHDLFADTTVIHER